MHFWGQSPTRAGPVGMREHSRLAPWCTRARFLASVTRRAIDTSQWEGEMAYESLCGWVELGHSSERTREGSTSKRPMTYGDAKST